MFHYSSCIYNFHQSLLMTRETVEDLSHQLPISQILSVHNAGKGILE